MSNYIVSHLSSCAMDDSVDTSVVMSVYNAEERLPGSLQSILRQRDVSFELIVINDGSTDRSGAILDETAKADRRIRVIHQQNQGLTKALIRGCAEARGTFIARHDADDVSDDSRLSRQAAVMAARPEVSMTSCWTGFVGPSGEHLFSVQQSSSGATDRLLSLNSAGLAGPPHHGSVMFRRDLYERAGGYRRQFYFAQDMDLWIRLAECGTHAIVHEILYRAFLGPDAISSRYRDEQVKLTRIILESARLRRRGESDLHLLEQAEKIRPIGNTPEEKRRRQRAKGYYFLGSCAVKNGNVGQARHYFKQALRCSPFHIRSLIRLMLSSGSRSNA